MALISCPECRREISDKAPACPACGCPLAAPGDARGDSVSEVAKTAGKVAGVWLVAGTVPWIARLILGIVAVVALFGYLAFSARH